MKTMGAAQFKAQCLSLLETVGPEGLIITKHGKPVAKLIPIQSDAAALIGSLKRKIRSKASRLSTGTGWNAESSHAGARGRAPRRADAERTRPARERQLEHLGDRPLGAMQAGRARSGHRRPRRRGRGAGTVTNPHMADHSRD